MILATQAVAVTEVAAHLFEFAERDRLDRSTEFGGIIALDELNRFEVIEFAPRVRHGDNRYNAPNELFERGATALFHFHFHAQQHDNDRYAGPHMGDMEYADNTRANCLVFTFVDERTLNVDYYRHGRVIVDLGEVVRVK
jgi:hypothetical protein